MYMKLHGNRFWAWYERHYWLTISVSTGLFALQIVHLYWLTTAVVMKLLLGHSYFTTAPIVQLVLILVDYTEIPALIATSLIYINDLRKKFTWKSVLFLIFLNSQWLHLFWITDEFVVDIFRSHSGTILPLWLAWIAILIDYLELPVIVDTVMRMLEELMKGRFGEAVRQLRERD
jgi:hypothetical protein